MLTDEDKLLNSNNNSNIVDQHNTKSANFECAFEDFKPSILESTQNCDMIADAFLITKD